ncbi:MAG: class I SAM-dependent methyltransferase, partial [Gemmatimonadota bacterium]|nr:class I SAM-dependent methyltransferase [Gemmatimonadota bacterium]
MSEQKKKYYYNGSYYTWNELDTHLDRTLDSSFPGNNRLTRALEMVEGERVLDMGAYIAFYSNHLARQGYKVVAAEVDPDALEIARRKYSHPNLEIVRTDGKTLELEDESFDTVLLLEVLEHSEHPRGLVEELHRVLKPSGTLIISVPNAAGYHTLVRTLFINMKPYLRKMESWPRFTTDQRDHFFYWDIFTLYRLLN